MNDEATHQYQESKTAAEQPDADSREQLLKDASRQETT
jgi:hypothetical protein